MNEGKIWGDFPSKSAIHCLELFKKYKIKRVLVPGAGYGRHTKLFSENEYQVMGIEISKVALTISKEFDSQTEFVQGSVLDMNEWKEKFDAIYCFNVLHLFSKENRRLFISDCYKLLSSGGFCFFTVFSDEDPSFGKGKENESYTFESKPGRPTHYFTEIDLLDHFQDYYILERGVIEEPEDHSNRGPHTHILRYIFAQKSKD